MKKPYLLARLTKSQELYAQKLAAELVYVGVTFKVATHPSCYLFTVFCIDDAEYGHIAKAANKNVPEANII